MLLTLTSTAPSASDLGFLLHKHPERVQRSSLSVGTATVYYPEASDERCTVALSVTVDPIALVKQRGIKAQPGTLGQYVNDRPYAAGSMLALAIGKVFTTALNGRCDARPDLAASPLPLTVHLPAMAVRPDQGQDANELVTSLFGPLGWQVETRSTPLLEQDAGFDWGPSPYLDVTLTGTLRLADALSHLYVLLPVLDRGKHYWISTDEVDKLLRRGGDWLPGHPQREFITGRYLGAHRGLVDDALTRLEELDDRLPAEVDSPETDDAEAEITEAEATDNEPEARHPLRKLRLEAVLAELHRGGAHSVADVGCGEGAFLRHLLPDPQFTRVLGLDVSARELERAERKLNLDRLSDTVRGKLTLRQSSVTYRDDALTGFDAILLVEVLEHVDEDRHPSLEANIFGAAQPGQVIVTTPNGEHNARYGLGAGQLRHPDHRFEWTREQFAAWAARVAQAYGYRVTLGGIGDDDPELGPPTQLAVFTRTEEASHG
ncbi:MULTISPECIES: 3' terminal RNA ribose 2'-O-methyltransferase Hen1 [unclassified Luteococcus]|uniref:3' terminal RNA ribose 2'-O-methyltransferase Hen1 n=1 Tax=unclassified Luteococcus TaxID=2639923 RepID=UPI00313C81C6